MGATGTGTSMPNGMVIDSMHKIHQLQMEMGQSGDEAGVATASPNSKLYANTGKSFNINAFLNSDGATITSYNSNWNGLVSKAWVQNAIKQIDAGMKPLSQSVSTTRFIDGDSLGYIMPASGITSSNFNSLISKLESGAISKKDFSSALKGANYTHKAYTSTTYTQQHGSYGDRDIRLNMVVKKGTPAIVTNNHKEHEILVGRNQKYNFTGNYHIETTSTGKKQLVLDVYI